MDCVEVREFIVEKQPRKFIKNLGKGMGSRATQSARERQVIFDMRL